MAMIAIDGPSGAGKSTLSKQLAEHLQYVYIDTGAMYRAVALRALRANISMEDIPAIEKMLETISIELQYGENGQLIFLDGEDVSSFIRTPEVSMAASAVSAIPAVRFKMVDLQRKIAENKNVIMDGRDIGTYVLPQAEVKIFLTASLQDRAYRRFLELQEKGQKVSLQEVEQDMQRRDHDDSNRAMAPLKPAEDAIILNTTGFSKEESFDLLLQTIKNHL